MSQRSDEVQNGWDVTLRQLILAATCLAVSAKMTAIAKRAMQYVTAIHLTSYVLYQRYFQRRGYGETVARIVEHTEPVGIWTAQPNW